MCGRARTSTYVLITPVKDEERYLPGVVDSIGRQTVKPLKWIIVSDGSIDGTDAIAREAARLLPFVSFIRVDRGMERRFGAKANAFRIGSESLSLESYDYIGNLDADVTLPPNYYESLMNEMIMDTSLGVISGVCLDRTPKGYERTISSLDHAVGAVQFWRRSCFEMVGGYRTVTVGGTDSLAEAAARFHGWRAASIERLHVLHHKPIDSAGGRSASRAAYRAGLTDYYIGTHPVFAIIKAIRRWSVRPRIVSTALRTLGYVSKWATGEQTDAEPPLVDFVRREQSRKLRSVVHGPMKRLLMWSRPYSVEHNDDLTRGRVEVIDE